MMTIETIHESEMSFGPFPEGHCFYIEKSKIYKKLQPSVQIAEFLLIHSEEPPVVWIVEAKSSSPHPMNQTDFDVFIDEIKNKLVNAFSLGMAACLNRHQLEPGEISPNFSDISIEKVDCRFILVIKGHQESWLAPLKDALEKVLHVTLKIWGLQPKNSVVVLNDDLARQYHLIQ